MEVLRRDAAGKLSALRLQIKPHKWAGKGVLGARFDPISG